MLRRGCSWKRVEAFPGLGIALSLLTVLVYQVSTFNIQCLVVQMLSLNSTSNSIVTTPLNAKSPKHFHSHILVFPVWKCSCQKDDCKYICDGLLERDLSGAPGDFSICKCVVFCLLLSISALYFIACVCSMLRHSSTVDRILSPATSFLSLQSGNDKTI